MQRTVKTVLWHNLTLRALLTVTNYRP